MKNKMNKITLLVMTAVLSLGMTGCSTGGDKTVGTEEECKPAVAYMVARTANAKPADSSAPLIQDTMINCADNFGFSYIVRVDGEPELVSAEDLDIPEQYKNASKERLERDALNRATNLLKVMDEVTAVYPEVDYLEGLRCAADSLHSLDDSYTSRTIICCGTGLGTQGYMDFQNNLLSADPKVIVEMLNEREALPNLEGITVYWLSMGQVAAPQEKLTPKQNKNLENIWKAVIEAAGGEFVANEYITVAAETNTTGELPSVSTVKVPSEIPISFETEVLKESEVAESAFEEPVSLGESQVEFVGDQSVYLHPDEAVEIIRPIAEYLLDNKSVPLLLIGSTAGDVTNESTMQLSRDRAEAVKKTLTELGVDGSRITVIGMGSDDPWHVYGAGYDGPVASGNRKVVLIDARTELAIELMKNS